MVKADTIEVEIDNAKNFDLFFQPLARPLRGRLVMSRIPEPSAAGLARRFADAIPGQRVVLSTGDATATIVEPLRDDSGCATIREKLAKKGFDIPKTETHEGIDVPTWLFHLRRAVEAGYAKVIRGSLPSGEIKGARKSFFGRRASAGGSAALASENADLRELVKTQAAQIGELAKQVSELLSLVKGK